MGLYGGNWFGGLILPRRIQRIRFNGDQLRASTIAAGPKAAETINGMQPWIVAYPGPLWRIRGNPVSRWLFG